MRKAPGIQLQRYSRPYQPLYVPGFIAVGMRYDDPAIGIPWPDVGMKPILSEKDTRHPGLAEIEPWRG